MPSRFGTRRRGRAAREEFTDTAKENIVANRFAPRVRAQEPAGTRAKIKGIREFAKRAHTGQAEQIRRGQDIQAEQERQNQFQRESTLTQQAAQRKREQFGQRQTIARGERDEQRLKLEGRRVDISGRSEERRRETQAQRTAKLQRPKAGVGAGVISKKPSGTAGYYMTLFERLAPFSEIDLSEVDDEGNFTNQATRNTYLDALDVYAQRNPGANEEEAVRWAAQVSGLEVPKSDQQPSAPTQPGQATQQLIPTRPVPNIGVGQQRPLSRPPAVGRVPTEEVAEPPQRVSRKLSPSGFKELSRIEGKIAKLTRGGRENVRHRSQLKALERKRERLISKPAPKARTTFSKPQRTAEEEAQRIASRDERLAKHGVSPEVESFEKPDGTLVIRNKALTETPNQIPRESPADIALNKRIDESGLFDDGTPQQRQQPVQGRRQFARPQAVATPAQEQQPTGSAWADFVSGRRPQAPATIDQQPTDVNWPDLVSGKPSRSSFSEGVTGTQIAGAVGGASTLGQVARGIDTATGGPGIRDRQTGLATLENALSVLQSGSVTGAASKALRKVIGDVNNLMSKDDLSEQEELQLERSLKILQERYSQ